MRDGLTLLIEYGWSSPMQLLSYRNPNSASSESVIGRARGRPPRSLYGSARNRPSSSSSTISREETYDGAGAVAAPVRDDEGRALGAFGVATPISHHSRAVGKGNRDAVIDVAARAASDLRLAQRTEHA